MQSVGEKLREERLKKQVSLDDVYKETKVHPRILEALEQDRAHNFLSPIYIKGFIRTYARYLGLDAEALLKEYIDSQKTEPPAEPELVLEKRGQAPFKALPNLKPLLVFRIALSVLLTFGLIFYFRYVWKHISTADKKAKAQKVRVQVLPARGKIEAEDLVVEIKTLDECWLRVKTDGESVFEKTLAKGKNERWQAKERIELRIGKPEAVQVLLNGKPIDLKKVKVKRSLLITQNGIAGK